MKVFSKRCQNSAAGSASELKIKSYSTLKIPRSLALYRSIEGSTAGSFNTFHKFYSSCYAFFIVLLLTGFSSVFAAEDNVKKNVGENRQKIISTLQAGISIIKHEIERDEAVASGMMLRRTIRALRQTLKKDIEPKKQIVNDLRSLLLDKLSNEIASLVRTIEQEKTIIENIQTSKRVRRVARNIIKESIPLKKQALASFEKVLSEY
jgi:hypothetical protein